MHPMYKFRETIVFFHAIDTEYRFINQKNKQTPNTKQRDTNKHHK